MGFNNDSNMQKMVDVLTKNKNELFMRRKQILDNFRTFLYDKLAKHGLPFTIKYTFLNDSEDLEYANLNLGDEFVQEVFIVTFDPKKNEIVDYISLVSSGIKHSESLIDDVLSSGSKLTRKTYQNTKLEDASDFNKTKIEAHKKEIVEDLLKQIIDKRIIFEDVYFADLYKSYSAIEKEYQRVDNRLNGVINNAINLENEKHI